MSTKFRQEVGYLMEKSVPATFEAILQWVIEDRSPTLLLDKMIASLKSYTPFGLQLQHDVNLLLYQRCTANDAEDVQLVDQRIQNTLYSFAKHISQRTASLLEQSTKTSILESGIEYIDCISADKLKRSTAERSAIEQYIQRALQRSECPVRVPITAIVRYAGKTVSCTVKGAERDTLYAGNKAPTPDATVAVSRVEQLLKMMNMSTTHPLTLGDFVLSRSFDGVEQLAIGSAASLLRVPFGSSDAGTGPTRLRSELFLSMREPVSLPLSAALVDAKYVNHRDNDNLMKCLHKLGFMSSNLYSLAFQKFLQTHQNELSDVIHGFGLNLRCLGKMWRALQLPEFVSNPEKAISTENVKSILASEMCARSVKQMLREQSRQYHGQQLRQTASSLLSNIYNVEWLKWELSDTLSKKYVITEPAAAIEAARRAPTDLFVRRTLALVGAVDNTGDGAAHVLGPQERFTFVQIVKLSYPLRALRCSDRPSADLDIVVM